MVAKKGPRAKKLRVEAEKEKEEDLRLSKKKLKSINRNKDQVNQIRQAIKRKTHYP